MSDLVERLRATAAAMARTGDDGDAVLVIEAADAIEDLDLRLEAVLLVSEDDLTRMSRALRIIGNMVGGPTMGYEPSIELKEWHERAFRISKIVEAALEI